jgi:hypothetical protein
MCLIDTADDRGLTAAAPPVSMSQKTTKAGRYGIS